MARTPAPKIPCPMSGTVGSSWGARQVECEHCGKLVFCSDAGRYARHDLPAGMARRAATRATEPVKPTEPSAILSHLFTPEHLAKVFGYPTPNSENPDRG